MSSEPSSPPGPHSTADVDLTLKSCQPCAKGTPALSEPRARERLQNLPGWELNLTASEIAKTYTFKNYHETMAFVNATAWISHHEDHHPDLEVGYNRCRVTYSTHSVGGLSENDFICAAKVERLG